MTRPLELARGHVLADRYEIIERVGQGGMGALYRARHTQLDRQVAVKLLLRNLLANEKAYLRFKQEAKVCASLNHRNLVTVYDFGETSDGVPFLVMDFLEGKTLSEVVEKDGRLDWRRAAQIVSEMLGGLQYAHDRGLVHRDLKPSNVMLVVDNGEEVVKLMDFGIAKRVDVDAETAQNLTHTGEVFGSPLYMSPEQCQGMKLDGRADVYSLGCMLYELVTGSVPLKGENAMQTLCKHMAEMPAPLAEAAPGVRVPGTFEELIFRCLQKQPDNRPQSAKEVKDALTAILAAGDDAEVPTDASTNASTDASTNASTDAFKVQDKTVVSGAAAPEQPRSEQAPHKSGSSSGLLPIVAVACLVCLGIAFLVARSVNFNGSTSELSDTGSGATNKSMVSTPADDNPEKSSTGVGPEETPPKKADLPPEKSGESPKNDPEEVLSEKVAPPAKTDMPPKSENPPKTEVVAKATVSPKVETVLGSPENVKPAQQSAQKVQPIDRKAHYEKYVRDEVFPGCKAKVDQLVGADVVWDIDYASFKTEESMSYLGSLGVDRVCAAIESVCATESDRETVRGKVKKIVIRNVLPKQSGVTFINGELTVEGAFGDTYPTEGEIRRAVENGVL